MSRIQNAVSNTFFGLFLKLYQIVLPFVMRTLMLRTLGIEYLGLNSLFTSVLQTLSIAELGISGAITFSMYGPIAQRDNQRICALLRLYRLLYGFIGLAVLLLGTALIPFLPRLISGEVPADLNIYVLYLMYLISAALSYSFLSYRSCILEAHQHNSVISKINLVCTTIQFALQIVILLIFKNYYIFILTQFVVQLLNQALVFTRVKRQYPHLKPQGSLDRQIVGDIFRKVKDLFTARLGGIILHTSDTIVISMFLGLTPLAVYQNYFMIVNSISGLIATMLNGSLAGIGNSIVTETKEKNLYDLRRFTFLLSGIVCVCTSCFMVLFQPFMRLWMGEEALLPLGMVVLFCIYFVIYEYNQLFNLYKDAAGIWHEDRFRPLVTSLTNLGLNLYFVSRIGLYGILASTVLSVLLVGMPWLLHNLFHTLFHQSLRGYLSEIFRYWAVIAAACLASYFISCLLHLEGIPGLILAGMIAVGVSGCTFLAVFRRSEYLADALRLFRRVILRQ